jgi:hypothetical protein
VAINLCAILTLYHYRNLNPFSQRSTEPIHSFTTILRSWFIMGKIFVVDSLHVSPFRSILYQCVSNLHRNMQCATEPGILHNKCKIFRAISEELKISKVSYFGIHRTIVHVWDIAITRVLGIIRVLQMPYIVRYQPYILHTLTDISYYEFWSVNEQFVISGLKITGLTKVRTVRLYNIWTFRVAKICKDRNKTLHVLHFNFRYSVYSGAFSTRKAELQTCVMLF